MELNLINKISSIFVDNLFNFAILKKSRIVFLSRDGYRIKNLFDQLVISKNVNIESTYIPVSRQYLNIANISTPKDIEILLSEPCAPCKISFILKNRFYCDDSKIENICTNLNVDKNKIIHRNKDKTLYISMIEIIWQQMNTYYMEQNLIAEKFYCSKINEGDIIVDLGYRGTIQKKLQNLTGKILYGFYLFANKTEIVLNNNEYYCLVPFEKGDIISCNLILFESIFTAPHGSLKNIKIVDGTFETTYLPYTCYDDFFSIKYKKSHSIFIKFYVVFFIILTNKRKVNYFSSLYVDDGFGGNRNRHLIKPPLTPITFKGIFDGLNNSGWKEGYLWIFYQNSLSSYNNENLHSLLKLTIKSILKNLVRKKPIYMKVCKLRIILRLI